MLTVRPTANFLRQVLLLLAAFIFRIRPLTTRSIFLHAARRPTTAFMSTSPHTPRLGSCRLVGVSKASMDSAASLIRLGGLVAFPTETVYGLGANALDADAVRDIFKAKGRPLTDPLIVHVTSLEKALELVDISGDEQIVFKSLGAAFWPGPLTIIAKAADCIPALVTAQTGFVGLRVPMHPLATALIGASDRPIAAPSANRFGHVSPTKARHVLVDFLQHGALDKEVLILNAEGEAGTDVESQFALSIYPSCEVGIESTVLKIVSASRTIQILRQGAVVKSQVERVLQECKIQYDVEVVVRAVKMSGVPPTALEQRHVDAFVDDIDTEGQQAPGQAVTHYAPDIPCLIARSLNALPTCGSTSSSGNRPSNIPVSKFPLDLASIDETLNLSESDIARVVIVDLGGVWSDYSGRCLAYRDLSVTGDVVEAARGLFDALRWAETVNLASLVLLPYVATDHLDHLRRCEGDEGAGRNGKIIHREEERANTNRDLAPGLADRMFRAASGKVVVINIS